jgi:pimeloyl-ACP methyl ester carboxylesterase
VLAALAAASSAVAAPSTIADTGRECVESMVPVSIQAQPVIPGGPVSVPLPAGADRQEIFVRLCQPEGRPSTSVQMLIHGITYTHKYWDIDDPDGTERYSWETAATEAGYATLAIDRLGNGQSSRPLSTLVDVNTNAQVVRQLVAALRAGAIDGPGGATAFERVALVGHSYGSITSWFAASGNDEVDALVLTGATHNMPETDAPTLRISAPSYPAAADPRFAGMVPPLDPGYLTSRPGTREFAFYGPGTDVDPRIIANDEATKDTVTASELANYPVFFRTQLDVGAPVFLLIGTKDAIFCSQRPLDLGAPCDSEQALIDNERPWFGERTPSIEAHITEGAGHDLNAFRSSQESFGAAMEWLARTMPA